MTNSGPYPNIENCCLLSKNIPSKHHAYRLPFGPLPSFAILPTAELLGHSAHGFAIRSTARF